MSPQDRDFFNKKLKEKYNCEPGELQWKWRNPDTLPDDYTSEECADALIDALMNMGGVDIWNGDGLSCATQIVESVWKK